MRFWWVNHNQTAVCEINGGFLWSPQEMRDGRRSHFYENMRRARPGDYIVSFANTEIGNYGIVSRLAIDAPKPEGFEDADAYEDWAEDGWLVSVSWCPLDPPFRPIEHINQIRRYLPDIYSPIQNNGHGNQGAYLCEISQALFEILMELGHFDPEIQIQNEIIGQLDETEAREVINARRGQGTFRRNVEQIMNRCRVTGLEDNRLLIASHIMPWRACQTSHERLDGSNGLLLAPHIDRLFDKGLISFERDGRLLVSDSLDEITIERLCLRDVLERGVEAFSEAQDNYLDYHRNNVFLEV